MEINHELVHQGAQRIFVEMLRNRNFNKKLMTPDDIKTMARDAAEMSIMLLNTINAAIRSNEGN
jgi:hypothetical protein